MSAVESLDLKNLHVIVMHEFQSEDIQELNNDFFRNLSNTIGKLKNEDLPYKQRDHALFTAFAPYKKPRYAISIVIEHGGAGSSGAAPIAKKVLKKVLDRHELRKKYQLDLFQEV